MARTRFIGDAVIISWVLLIYSASFDTPGGPRSMCDSHSDSVHGADCVSRYHPWPWPYIPHNGEMEHHLPKIRTNSRPYVLHLPPLLRTAQRPVRSPESRSCHLSWTNVPASPLAWPTERPLPLWKLQPSEPRGKRCSQEMGRGIRPHSRIPRSLLLKLRSTRRPHA